MSVIDPETGTLPTKAESMLLSENDLKVELEDQIIPQVENFRYLRSIHFYKKGLLDCRILTDYKESSIKSMISGSLVNINKF